MNLRTHPETAALLLRLSLGVMFIAHALLKIMVFTPSGTAGFFSSIGLPGWLAYPTMGAELLGGVLLIAGFHSRVVVAALLPVLIGAVALVHGGNGWMFGNEGGGWEYPAFLIIASLVQYLLGDGAYSVREWLGKSSSVVSNA